MPIQQMLLGVGAVAKTYVDDIFSTYLWKGSGSNRSINNGINLSGKGGLVWVKARNDTHQHHLFDTVRGANEMIASDSNSDEATVANRVTAFNNNGFTLGSADQVNGTSADYTSWTFRKSSAFTIKEYTGTGSTQSISHDLGSVPGCIMIKRTDDPAGWAVYHRGVDGLNPENYALGLDNSDARSESANYWNDTAPTATHFTVKTSGSTNTSGATYIAYIFAGGKKNDDNAVNFDGSGDYLSLAASSDLTLDADFTIEWFSKRQTGGGMSVIGIGDYNNVGGMEIFFHTTASGGKVHIYTKDSSSGANRLISADAYAVDRYQHCALVRSGSTITFYLDGKNQGSWTESQTLGPSGNNTLTIGRSTYNGSGVAYWNGKISNFRITKGQALYTTNFNVPHDALTQTSQNAVSSNVKLLCCNGSTTTSSTVTPGTITANGDPNIQGSQYIFDDTAAHVFGDAGDQNLVKCGRYVGNGNADGPEINLGWEPQWVIIKNASAAVSWHMFDSMRGIPTGASDVRLEADETGSEFSNTNDTYNYLDLTPTGFKIKTSGGWVNTSGQAYIYMCIRRPDGYVGKPPELGTSAFNVVYGNSSSNIPNFASNFVVDMGIYKEPASSYGWYLHTRLTGQKALRTDTNAAQMSNDSDATFDSNAGWGKFGYNTDKASWLWKRHAGFDVVTWTGDGVHGRQISHSLNNTAQMLWIKRRSGVNAWTTGHIGLNGGTNPWNYYVGINETSQETDDDVFADTAPTSTHFTIGGHSQVNSDGEKYIAMLFASVEGISKVGYFDGQNSDLTVTFGFQPRFLMVKRADSTGDWNVYDTTRGLVSGADKELRLNDDSAQSDHEVGDITSTGFTFACGGSHDTCSAGGKWIYYAHA